MCMYDDSEGAAIHRAVQRRARRDHRCTECRRTIIRGDTYEYVAALYDGHWSTAKTCERCEIARSWLSYVCHGWVYDGVIEDLQEHVDEYGLLDTWALRLLVIWATNQWHYQDGTDVPTAKVRAMVTAGLVKYKRDMERLAA